MRFSRFSLLLLALALCLALLSHAAPLPKSKAIGSSSRVLKAAKVKAPVSKAPKVKVKAPPKVKAKAPAKVKPAKVAKPKATKAKAVKAPKKTTEAVAATKKAKATAAAKKTKPVPTAAVKTPKAKFTAAKTTKAKAAAVKTTKPKATPAKTTKVKPIKPAATKATAKPKVTNAVASKGTVAKIKPTKAASVKATAKATKASAIKTASTRAKATAAVKTPKAKATTAKAAKSKAIKAAATKPAVKASSAKIAPAKATSKATKAAANKATAAKTKGANAAKQTISAACSRPGANRRADAECSTPAVKPKLTQAEKCLKLTTCDACVNTRGKCAFDGRSRKCFASNDDTLFTSPAIKKLDGCQALEAQKQQTAAAQQAANTPPETANLLSQARTIFRDDKRPNSGNSLQDHLSSPFSPIGSGRHLFSLWKAKVADGSVTFQSQPDPVTRIAELNLRNSKIAGAPPVKTVWMDALPEGTTGAVYSRTQINQMCIDAIAQVLKENNKKFVDLPGSNVVARSHGIVVAGINGSKVCMAISRDSCFPKSIQPAAGNLGDHC